MQKLISLFAGLFAMIALSAYATPSTALTLTTTAFQQGGTIPIDYTCDGKNISPELGWTNVPTKTQSLVMIVSDPDAPSGTFYHWIVYNIPPSIKIFQKNTTSLPKGAIAGKNDFGKVGYGSPCPPKGSSHTYVFTLYALDSNLNLPTGADAKTIECALKKHVIEKATLTAVYSR